MRRFRAEEESNRRAEESNQNLLPAEPFAEFLDIVVEGVDLVVQKLLCFPMFLKDPVNRMRMAGFSVIQGTSSCIFPSRRWASTT